MELNRIVSGTVSSKEEDAEATNQKNSDSLTPIDPAAVTAATKNLNDTTKDKVVEVAAQTGVGDDPFLFTREDMEMYATYDDMVQAKHDNGEITDAAFEDYLRKSNQLLLEQQVELGKGTVGDENSTMPLFGYGGTTDEMLGDDASSGEDQMSDTVHAEALAAIETDNAEKKIERDAAITKSDKAKADDILSEGLKAAEKMGKMQKESAIVSQMMKTAKAMAKANEVGFPASIPAMAKVAADGAKKLGIIKGQFHGGIDEVPESGTYLLEKGERVVSRNRNDMVKMSLIKMARASELPQQQPLPPKLYAPKFNVTLKGRHYMNESQLDDYKDRITDRLTGIADYLGHYYDLHDPAELDE